MGNLIIKGKGGAGNKLIIQDQAGGAVLTTADSGATIANSTLTTPTLNTPTLNTPTIANMANCTFPTGHVVRTQTSGTIANTGLSGSSRTGLCSYDVTGVTVGNKLLVVSRFNMYRNVGSTNNYCQVFINVTNPTTRSKCVSASHYRWPASDTYSDITGVVLTNAATATTMNVSMEINVISSSSHGFALEDLSYVVMEVRA